MSITRDAARLRLKQSLMDAASIFGIAEDLAAALDRHLDGAVADFNRVAPRLVTDELTLQAGVAHYIAPSVAIGFHSTERVSEQDEIEPWSELRVREVPTPRLVSRQGVKSWQFLPVPTQAMLARLGALYPYTYVARHVLADDEDDTTIALEHVPLLILRAQVESLRELAVRNAHKPVALRDPAYSQTRNGTPAALADQFFRMWEQQMRAAPEVYGMLRVAGGGA